MEYETGTHVLEFTEINSTVFIFVSEPNEFYKVIDR